MQAKSDLKLIKSKTLLCLAMLMLMLGIATPALADYLGPDRTSTESHVETYDYGVWAKADPGYPDNPTCSHQGGTDCIVCSWTHSPGNSCGDAEYWYTLGSKSEVVTTTVNLDPATISGTLQNCTLNNNWCITAPELSLSANEPLSGYNILAIEGSLNGQTFACSSNNCSIPLNEGDNSFIFWALSSYGDSSTMGTTSARVDTVSPDVGLDVSGSTATNNWFVSPTTVTATGSDSTSGLLSTLLSINNGAWESSATLNEGIYNVSVKAQDNAGNISNSSATISIDTTTPSIDISVTGTTGNNGWYISNTEVKAIANDTTSGIGTLEVSSDGGIYQAYTSPLSFSDGHHTIQFKATDKAGNVTETSIQELYVDTTAPTVEIPKSWEVDKTITYAVHDNGSSLSALRVVIEDEDEKYAKIFWDESVSGANFEDEVTWNGKFADKKIAPPGEYLVWIKASDKAGNEYFGLGRVIVPDPNLIFSFFKADTTFQGMPIPPKELSEPVDSITQSPAIASSALPTTSFGGSTAETREVIKHSFSLSSGTASSSTTPQSDVLWGASAVAVIGAATAYALDERRKRKEEEARQLAEAEAKAAKLNAAEEERKVNAWLEGQAILKAQHDAAILQAQIAHMEAMAYVDEEETKWLASQPQPAIQKRGNENNENDEKARTADSARWAGLASQGQHAANMPPMMKEDKPSLQNAWDVTKSLVQEKIIQPYIKPAVTAIDEKIYQPYIKPLVEKVKETQVYRAVQHSVTPKNIASSLIAITLGASTVQWVNNIKFNPDIFLPAHTYTQELIQDFRTTHPTAPENHTLSYLFTHPYDAISTGVDVLNTLTSISASYADTIWQQNPLAQITIKSLEKLEGSLCSQITSQAWENRCTSALYLAAGLTATPFDTASGVVNGFLVDPVAGLIKHAALAVENFEALPNFVSAIRDQGWQGAKDFLAELFRNRLEIVQNDKQVQSTLFFAGLALLALIAAPVAGGIILGMTTKGLMDIDSAVTTTKDKESLIELITSHNVRTTVVSSVLVLALMAAGLGKQVSEFQAFQDGLSPSAQLTFQEFSLLEQTRIADLAVKMKIPPSALEFYLTETARAGSPLVDLPLTDALGICSLAEQSGQGAFILDYLRNYGLDSALKNTSPEALSLYADLVKTPDSLFQQTAPQDGISILNGKVTQVDPALATDLAAELAKHTGKNVWGSDVTGSVYLSKSSPKAIAAAKQLILEGINSPNAPALIKIISLESIRGSGGSFKLGPFMVKDPVTGLPTKIAGVEKGIYIQDALNNNARFFDVGEVWSMLEDAGIKFDELWPINQNTIQIMMESKTPIDFVYTDVDSMLEKYEDSSDAAVPIRVREMRWVKENADIFGYIQEENSWIWQPNP